jgi:hypothetical protein
VKIIFVLFVSGFIASCTTQTPLPQSKNPFEQPFISDLEPVTNPNDLRQLIKSLPVWESREPGFSDGWLTRMAKLKGDTLAVAGDGAQDQLRFTRLATTGQFELEVGNKDWPEGGHSIYRLKRANQGWQVLSKPTSL